MDTRNTLHSRRRSRGAFRPVAIAILVVIGLLAIAAWFLIVRPYQAQVLADAGGHPSTPVAATTSNAAPPPANVQAMGTSELLSEAGKAVREQRLLAPAGNNAFEFYLRVLEKQPGNQVATDALRETFPFAATSAEQVINRSDFGEAQRQIDLLAKADPTNFTLTILRSKLDAQRKVLDKQQQQLVLDQQKAQELAQQKEAADKLAAEQQAAQAAQVAAQQKAQPTRTPQRTTAADTAPAPSAQDNAAITEAVLVKGAAARYPPSAMRAQQEGWVIVSFMIDPDGRTSHIDVVSSEPRRVFDRAAIEAVGRYVFTPATRGGVPTASKQQQRIEFKLR
ncbi:energy transducer TonB [Rhodanobacter sp. Root627]|uniref:energy transducer TonB n=1 Tax=Rhodanobacter sp. Root627 TaxID=1736572 RepID=UPI0006F28BF2|nr:energy transducer TonB [Rhodanobacter sp. Root627]KRA30227.1 energy transducer TonB [Rhodanobacter sp. Root627]